MDPSHSMRSLTFNFTVDEIDFPHLNNGSGRDNSIRTKYFSTHQHRVFKPTTN